MSAAGIQRVAAYAVCLDAGRILLCRLSDRTARPGHWTLPGGGIDFGEAPVAAVLRELDEETGLTGRVDRLIDVWSHQGEVERHGAPVRYHALQILYAVTITGGTLRHEVDESTDMAAWCNLDEAEALPLVPLAAEVVALARAGRLADGSG